MYERHEGREIQESGKMWVKNGVLKKFIYFFAVLGLCFCRGFFFFFLVVASRGNRPVATHGLLLLAFLAVERGLPGMRASVAAARGS